MTLSRMKRNSPTSFPSLKTEWVLAAPAGLNVIFDIWFVSRVVVDGDVLGRFFLVVKLVNRSGEDRFFSIDEDPTVVHYHILRRPSVMDPERLSNAPEFRGLAAMSRLAELVGQTGCLHDHPE